jgi:hypothetical protein
MLEKLNQTVIRLSFSGWGFLLLFAGFLGSLQTLLWLGDRFLVQAGGNLPFDLQNSLTVEQMFAQLEHYTREAFYLYYVFAAVDVVFPLLGGLFLGAIWAFSLRQAKPKWYEIGIQKNLFAFALLGTLFDWVENLGLLAVILAWPERLHNAAIIAVNAKQLKLITLYASQGIAVTLLLFAAVMWLTRRLKK